MTASNFVYDMLFDVEPTGSMVCLAQAWVAMEAIKCFEGMLEETVEIEPYSRVPQYCTPFSLKRC